MHPRNLSMLFQQGTRTLTSETIATVPQSIDQWGLPWFLALGRVRMLIV
jgi:hypothetical protein